jgi:type VI secretion system protein ImpH
LRYSVRLLVPGQPAHREIMALLRFYLGYESEAELEMHVRADLMPEPTLTSHQTILGFTAQLEAPATHATMGAAGVTRVQLGRWRGASDTNA